MVGPELGLENVLRFGEEGNRGFGNGVSRNTGMSKDNTVSVTDRPVCPWLGRHVEARFNTFYLQCGMGS